MTPHHQAETLEKAARVSSDKILNPQALELSGIRADTPVLVLLAAGKGTRFGTVPKCVQLIGGVPLARHSINAFRKVSPTPAICLVGYRHQEVTATLGPDNLYVLSENPTGGTAFAAFEAFSVNDLERWNPILVVSMGDRIVTRAVFQRLLETHRVGPREAELTLLTATYELPRNLGKGRVVRDTDHRVLRIVEQRDIDLMRDSACRSELLDATEGNCPLYAIRAVTLRRYLARLNNDNAQGQFYFTDIVEAIRREGGEIRTITTTPSDPDHDLLCCDVTRPRDLALLEGMLATGGIPRPQAEGVEQIADLIAQDRPLGQVASIAAQLEELGEAARLEALDIRPDQPVGIGVSGGRLRIAFMHPDMGRFYGPAWQMPIGARDADGREQIVVLIQSAEDRKIHLHTTNPRFREKIDYVAADEESMYPGAEIVDWYSYEGFGTRMAENVLLSLGYFSDVEIAARRAQGQPLPPASLWVSNSMRRPFSLIGNAIASLRTIREGNLGIKVQTLLGREGFLGLRVVSTGSIPEGGFSSSSAVTLAVKNAINSLFELGIGPDLLVHLACQAEYGTGVRAGALDQATEQKGRAGQGELISSNPRENYRIIGTYTVPTARFRVFFPYSVDRDTSAWKWSAGCYAASAEPRRLTTAELRKMTGKASELAAILTRRPLSTDFFPEIEPDLIESGLLTRSSCLWVNDLLKQLPPHATQQELRTRLSEHRHWYIEQLMGTSQLPADLAAERTDQTFESLFAGWRDPTLRRTMPGGEVIEETGAPLRAMLGYLFGEVAKNCFLIHHPDHWIEVVSRSQCGDCCFTLDPERLPTRTEMRGELLWEKSLSGPALMERWLNRFGATPFDYQRDLDDASLTALDPVPWHLVRGSNFFRGLALIDLAEAMLKRAFGAKAVAVRVNAAGQGDFFQVHVDTEQVDAEEVKQFIRLAFYRRFGLAPYREFVEPHPGGGAAGVRLRRFDDLTDLIRALRARAAKGNGIGIGFAREATFADKASPK